MHQHRSTSQNYLFIHPSQLSRLCSAAAISLAVLVFFGCASEVVRQPTSLSAVSVTSAQNKSVTSEVAISFSSGFSRTIRKGTEWKLIGSVAQGDVYKPIDSVLTLEGAHVHEAYLVASKGNLIGFYLPVEKSFSALDPFRTIKLWE
jgi:hypothetical protein